MASNRETPPPARLVWRAGSAHVETRARYLLVVEEGPFTTAAEVARYHRWLDAWLDRGAPRRLLFDGRALKATQEPAPVRDARWAWLLRDEHLHRAAFVTSSEASLAKINMRAIAERANVRAFADLPVAHRWLCARTRTFPGTDSTTTRMRAVPRAEDRDER